MEHFPLLIGTSFMSEIGDALTSKMIMKEPLTYKKHQIYSLALRSNRYHKDE